MQFGDMNWMDVESYLQQDDRVIVVTGSCEQHAYLSLTTDVRIPLAVAEAAAQKDPVLIAPPVNLGVSAEYLAYPGTISLRPETFAMLMREVFANLIGQGFRGILVANGHGGNTSILRTLIAETTHQHADVRMRFYEWWRHDSVAQVARDAGLVRHHANWLQSFPFTRVTDDIPEGEKEPIDLPYGGSPEEYRAAMGDGSYGGHYWAPDEVTRRMFDVSVQAVLDELAALKGSSSAR
ncbi:MAG: creatininase family protein [Chloroflexi bacterium]|nr:creatininase family protein [Chloroflexota bacterium]